MQIMTDRYIHTYRSQVEFPESKLAPSCISLEMFLIAALIAGIVLSPDWQNCECATISCNT